VTQVDWKGSPWTARLFVIALAVAAAVLILLPSYAEIFNLWWTITGYNHCLLIVPISLYLAWLNRDALYALPIANSWFGVAYVCVNAVIWFFGDLLSLNVLEHAGSIGIVIGIVWSLLGNAGFRLMLFPLFYLYFGLPEGDFLVPYLQDLTAQVVVILLRASDIPVFLEGRYLTIPSGQFHVAKACSGINYLIATLAVGTVFAYLRFRQPWRRVAFMSLAILVPLAANGIRAYGIVMIAHLSNYKYAMGVDHFIYGWLFFGIVIFALFTLGNLFSDVDVDGAEVNHFARGPFAAESPFPLLPVAAIFLVLGGLRAMTFTGFGEGYADLNIRAPDRGVVWEILPRQDTALGSHFEGYDAMAVAGYRRADIPDASDISLEIFYYRRQAQGAEVIGVRNDIYDDERWRRVAGPTRRSISTFPGEVYEIVLRANDGQERRVWYWFDISGTPTLNTLEAKFFSKRAVFSGDYLGEAAVIVSTAITDAYDRSATNLADFIAEQPLNLGALTHE